MRGLTRTAQVLTTDRRPDGDLARLDASVESGAAADAAEVPFL